MHIVKEHPGVSSLNTVEEIIEDIRQGKMVVMMDDEDRENEGDLIMAAACVRPQDINFMARYGRGLICLTLTRERCERMRLPLMVSNTDARHATNFTISIEAARGVTTGISAADRATTIRAAVEPDAQATDLIQPGHIFPLMSQPGGVLVRAGHTEAGSDLARLAGFEPASVIVEILNDDGSMARRSDLEAFAQTHGLKIGTIADLIRYRMEKEKTVEIVAECRMPTAYGEFTLKAYRDPSGDQVHIALVYGRIDTGRPVLVRVHMQDALHDMLDAVPPESSCTLHDAMRAVVEAGCGVVVILRRTDDPLALIRQIEEYHRSEQGSQVVRPRRGSDLRTYGVGARILVDLGVRRMRVLGTPLKLHALSGFGLEIVEYIGCQ